MTERASTRASTRRRSTIGTWRSARKLIEFGGWLMPVQYAGILEEHRAVRERAGLFDLSHMGELFVEGPDAGDALAYALVTNPPTLAEGRAHYSMICAPRRRDHRRPHRLPARAGALPRRRQRLECAGRQRRAGRAARRLQGGPRRPLAGDGARRDPGAAVASTSSRPLTDVDLDALRYYAIAEGTVAGIPALVARTGYTGEDGFEVFVETARARELWDALVGGRRRTRPRAGRARRPRHAPPRGGHAALRQRARPRDEPVRGRAGPGRQARQAGRLRRPGGAREGRPRRSREAPRRARRCRAAASPGTATRSTPATGQTGVVTSGTQSPTLGKAIAMAYVAPADAEPGTIVDVEIREQRVPAEVVGLPFYRGAR